MNGGECFERNAVGLSPLAGVSDLPFRRLCAVYGADFTVTEMVSAKGLYYDSARTNELLEIAPEERAAAIQIFGSEPQIMAQVIREQLNPRTDFGRLDLNMGCPAPKIVRNGEGSALMKDPVLAGRVIAAMVKASNKPVSVKLRLGVDEDHINYAQIGRIAESEGAAFVTLHGRTARQMYSGRADWEAIAQLKSILKIPVVGNGDIRTPQEAKAHFELTGVDGIAIGRGAMGNPFIFKQIRDYMTTGAYIEQTLEEKLSVLRRQYRDAIAHKGQHIAILEMRKHIGWYLSGFPGATRLKQAINRTTDIDEIRRLIDVFEATGPISTH